MAPPSVSHPALLKLFSSLKRKATLLVHTPSSLPSLPTPPNTNQRSYPFQGKFSKSKRRQLKEFQRLPTPAILRRPPTAQCSPMMLSMRAHGLANYPRPPKIRTVRRPNSSRRHVPSSSTSSATSASSHHACRRKPVPAPLEMGDSTSTLVASEPKTPLTPDQEKIARLQDQIIALQRALSPTPPSPLDSDVAAKPPSHTRQSQSQDLEVEKPSLIQTVKRSSLLVPLTPSRPSSSSSKKSKRSSFGARRDAEEIDNPMDMAAAIEELASKWDRSKREAVYDPFAKDTVEIVHALPGFSTSVSLRRQANARSRPVSEAFTISGVSNTARDVLSTFSVETPPPVPTLPPP
ncbi:hypothetical protein ONZ45_g18118 [Pleurotus djamor]|nr:hypothetical protein ONZ45_g18118 [Pleurotus djamor]